MLGLSEACLGTKSIIRGEGFGSADVRGQHDYFASSIKEDLLFSCPVVEGLLRFAWRAVCFMIYHE